MYRFYIDASEEHSCIYRRAVGSGSKRCFQTFHSERLCSRWNIFLHGEGFYEEKCYTNDYDNIYYNVLRV